MSENVRKLNENPVSALADTDYIVACSADGTLHPISFANLRKGFRVGGRNLIRSSNVPYTGSGYPLCNYSYADVPQAGEQITVTVWASLGAGRTGMFAMNGSVSQEDGYANLEWIASGVYRGHMTVNKAASDGKLSFYPLPWNGTSSCTIYKVMVERGNVASDWSPAPEDLNPNLGGG